MVVFCVKMTSDYFKTLNGYSKVRYLDKIKVINNQDPCSLLKKDFSANIKDFPDVSYMDMVNYLVYGVSHYTSEDLKAYKSIQSYNLFKCGWVSDVYIKVFPGMHLVIGKVKHSQRLNEKLLQPWFISTRSRIIQSTHCTCMAGLGILTEEISDVPPRKSAIVASYVKFLEASGARVSPIFIYQTKEYYQDILSKINGVLLPGGNDVLKSQGYGRSGRIIFDIAVEMNDKGDYFPVWGTCLGFELLLLVAAKEKWWMKTCMAEEVPMNIEFTKDFKNSRMFSNLQPKLQTEMVTKNVTFHYHHWCTTPQNFTLSGLDKYFKALAVNEDLQNNTFVSIIEAFRYPFYGVAFHPEKVVFEWSSDKPIPHSAEAVQVSQYFGNFFVNETRKNFHKFPSKAAENSALIYNNNPVINGSEPSSQVYIFS